jgi:hypothetical protein
LDHINTPNLISLEQYLSICAGTKLATKSLQLPPKMKKIIYFTVVDQNHLSITAQHRLVAGRRRVQNGQSTMTQSYVDINKLPFVIRAAVDHGRSH